MRIDQASFPKTAFSRLAEAEDRHWWFRARNRLLVWVMKRKLGTLRNFLEVGCGTGFVLTGVGRAFPDATLFGTEYFEEGLAYARQRVPNAIFAKLDAREMDEANQYAAVGAFDVIEHIKEDQLVLDNLARALEKGGALLLTVPQHRWLWSAADERAGHVRRYTRKELINKVEQSGLDVVYVSSFVSLLIPLMWWSRKKRQAAVDGEAKHDELNISDRLNSVLEVVMAIELALMKMGIVFPIGGSLLLVAKKP